MKLKTLKDFEFKVDSDGNVCNLDDLRQKAIKWVKEDIEDMKSGKVFMAIDSTNRWMKRLNITEEDLKTKDVRRK